MKENMLHFHTNYDYKKSKHSVAPTKLSCSLVMKQPQRICPLESMQVIARSIAVQLAFKSMLNFIRGLLPAVLFCLTWSYKHE